MFIAQGRRLADEIGKLSGARVHFGAAGAIQAAGRDAHPDDVAIIQLHLDKILQSSVGQWDAALRQKIKGAFQLFGAKTNSGLYELKEKVDTTLYNKTAADFAAERLPKVTGQISDWTKARVSTRVRDGIKNGQSIGDTAKQIRDLFKEMSVSRSELIAQVETGIAASSGDYINAASLDLDLVKIWSSAEDDLVRESHVEVNEEVEDMDDLFGNDMLYPLWPDGDISEIANCRCAALYVPRNEVDEWV